MRKPLALDEDTMEMFSTIQSRTFFFSIEKETSLLYRDIINISL